MQTWVSTWLPVAVHAGVMAAVGSYALAKERQESGCRGWSATRRQCADERSVYIRGTAPAPGDTPRDIKRKLLSILSYHEKGGVWKRCFLLAAGLAYVAWVIQRAATPGWAPLLLHLVFFCLLYFWFNYLNYHHFRLLKKHGQGLLDALYAFPGNPADSDDDESDGQSEAEGSDVEGEGSEVDDDDDGPCMSLYRASLMRQASR